jgi:sugar phosphate isomerase/epimerase
MKLGFVSDSLGGLPLDTMLDHAVRMGVQGIEVNTGGWSTAPHFNLAEMKASASGVEQIALELHGSQCVYNVPSLLKLRAAVGPVVGANLDPSHLFWMGADPLAAIDALGAAVYHVHAKDTLLNAPVQAVTSLLENGSLTDIPARAWSYITLGHGHGETWWRQFCYRLLMVGYVGWLSIEHEDVLLNSLEGLEKSVALLQNVMPTRPADFKPQAI